MSSASQRVASSDGAVLLGPRSVRLSDRDLIGEGGEGRVYRLGDLAVKVFTAPDRAREEKLRAFPAKLPPRVIAPLELCTTHEGAVVGFSMRALDGAVDLHRFAQRSWREGRVSNAAVLGLFRELSETVAQLHASGVVVGDLNDGNVMATASSRPGEATFTPWLIDVDSMQFGPHACVVAHERFLDPRLYGIDLRRQPALSRESDWYALAVLLFGSLLYVHPFGGAHPSHPTLLRRAEARFSVLRPDVKLPSVAARIDVLPDDALAWFERVFERDARTPLSSSILEARFTRCSCGAEHARSSCPVCAARVHVVPVVRARGRIRATRVFTSRRGRIVSAAAHGPIEYAYEEGGVLFREDGSEVLLASDALVACHLRAPDRFVRVSGSATWIGAGGRLSKVVAGRVAASLPVGLVQGDLAADVGPGGLVHVDGDALVRAESGTRIGQVLGGQTRVRVGATLGFAFYRAGSITVAFLFDVRRGALRQVEGFPRIEGKLVGWSAVFDHAHALVTFATEKDGRLEHVAHLIDARGELVATHTGVAHVGGSLAGRAVAGGSLIAATDEGLVLLRADRRDRAFVPVRLFPEAKEFVSPDADLLVGPGGSLYVVTHDEITHLRFVETA